MIDNNSISAAEERVKEMNRLTGQYLEQSNRYINQRNSRNMLPRFETMQGRAVQNSNIIQNNNTMRNNMVRNGNNAVRSNNSANGRNNGGMRNNNSNNTPQQNKCSMSPPQQNGIFGFLSGTESDRILLMALMAILLKEKADMKLILALGYILL